jgi:hypothetical protein
MKNKLNKHELIAFTALSMLVVFWTWQVVEWLSK